MNSKQGPIGVFDSGYGGLTVLREIVRELPDYDYIYLGDNGRAPYGSRSFETVYHYTLECVQHLFRMGCHLVVLACNTASAKALRTIQQNDLPRIDPERRVLGIIRPTTEIVGDYSRSREVGVFGTAGTVTSDSYPIEIEKFFPDIQVYQQACPMWVPLVENGEYDSEGADFFINKYVRQLMVQSEGIDTIVLGCTHYPLLEDKIRRSLPPEVTLLSQGPLAAKSLAGYLQRHPEMAAKCSRGGNREFYTTDDTATFDRQAGIFYGHPVQSRRLTL
ncbi:glutamate racemase [Chitinophaga lutea]